MSRFRKADVLFAITLMLASCHIPPIVTTVQQYCESLPDLTMAKQITTGILGGATIDFDDKSACLQPEGESPKLYAVFRLPQHVTGRYYISVNSVPGLRGNLITPHLILLNEHGSVQRRMTPDNFVFRGTSLNTKFYPHTGDTYLLVTSDPHSIGQISPQIIASTYKFTRKTPTNVDNKGKIETITTEETRGRERVELLTRAHNGTISVSAEMLPQPR